MELGTAIEALRYGVHGLAFLLAFLAYRLIKTHIEKDDVKQEVIRTTRMFIVLALGLGIIGLGAEAMRIFGGVGRVQEERTHFVVDDARFWREMYDHFPPSFIKRYSPNEEHAHVIDNAALRAFEGPMPPAGAAQSPQEVRIRADHRRGDDKAYTEGVSFQLELTAPGERPPQPILTRKVRVDYGDEQYILGIYAPVELGQADYGSELCIRQNAGLAVIALSPVAEPGDCLTVDVGATVQSR